jgi:anti-sigma B factor antagonist
VVLKILQRKIGAVTVLDLEGKVILGEPSNRLLETTKNLLTQGERNLLLNLAEVSYLDSAGLGSVVQCYSSVLHSNGRLKLLKVPARILELLRTTKLQSRFEMFEDEATALESYDSMRAQ